MTTRRVEPAAAGAAVAGALGAWCACGALTIDGAATRVGALPPLWLLALFGVTTLLAVIRTRATARDAAPLWCPLISILPWLPVPLPAAATLWVGPLGQILAAAALAHVVARRGVPSGWMTRARPIPAVIVLASLFGAAAWWLAPRIPGGDEPHYLVIAQSLLHDGDLRIENNHRRRDYTKYLEGEIRPDYLRRGSDGAIYSVHAPGLPALVAPAFLAGGYPGVVAMLALLGAVGVLAAWQAAREVSGDPTAATVAAAGVGLSVPFFFQAFTVYPDGPAAVCVAVVVRVALTRRDELTWPRAAVCGALLGTLPWLHTRYAAIACALGAVVVTRALWPPAGARTLGSRLCAAGALALPAMFSAAAWFWSFHTIYGTFDPRAPYGHATDMRLARIPHGLAGLFLDQQFGLLPNAPIYLIAVVGLGALWRRNRRLTCELAALATPYLLAVAGFHMWWGGRSSPARFLVPVLLPFAMPIAAWWVSHSTRAARAAALALLSVTLGITTALVVVDSGALVYNSRDGHSLWLLAAASAVNLTYALPSLFQTAPTPAVVTSVAWLAAIAGGGALLRWLDGRGIADGVFRAATLGTAALVCSAGAAMGWLTSGHPAADPGAGTVTVLSRACDSGAIGVQTWPFTATSSSSLTAGRPIADASRRPRRDVTRWTASDLPPGRYHLRIDSGINVTGRATVALGRPDAPIAACEFDDRPSQTATCLLWLPAGASALFVEGDQRLRRTATDVVLVFEGPERRASCATRALRAIDVGSLTLFVTRGRAWTEGGGLWTAGASDVALVAATDDERRLQLRLRQGGAGGEVVIRSGEWADRRTLAPGAPWDVEIPRRAGERATAFTVSTTAAFRPSEVDTASRDSRSLGVWIEIAPVSN